MEKFLNSNHVEKFRKLMNHSFYGYKNFKDVNGKDDWGLICSQMDWIESWVNEIENIKTKGINEHRNTINITQFILGIDIIVTATKQLLEYFSIDHQELLESKSIFTKEHFKNVTDFDYFKRIRSTCAIHPTDIQAGKGKKYYASWVANYAFSEDFVISIYDYEVGKKDIRLVVKKKELIHFAKTWYDKIDKLNSYLEPIITQVHE